MPGAEGKVVAITGAGSGIGKATALLLAGQQAKLVLGGRRMERLQAVGAEIEAGKHTFESLEKLALGAPDPVQRQSGRQEMIENLLNDFL